MEGFGEKLTELRKRKGKIKRTALIRTFSVMRLMHDQPTL